jgi:hypothetical protein
MGDKWDATGEPTAREFIRRHMPPGEERRAALWRMGIEPELEDYPPARVDAARVARDLRRQQAVRRMGVSMVRRVVSAVAGVFRRARS